MGLFESRSLSVPCCANVKNLGEYQCGEVGFPRFAGKWRISHRYERDVDRSATQCCDQVGTVPILDCDAARDSLSSKLPLRRNSVIWCRHPVTR